MSSKTSKYRNYGLVRLKNLSDLEDVTEAVNNLLNNLPVTVEGKTFISQDLDVIRGIKNLPITVYTFRDLVGNAPFADQADPATGLAVTKIINPIVRIKDTTNKYRSYTGTPGSYLSGNGLRSYFFRPEYLNDVSSLSPTGSSTLISSVISNEITDYTDDLRIPNENFWKTGEFQFNTRLYSSFNPGPGAILHEGYYIFDRDGPLSLIFKTAGRFHWEIDDLDGTIIRNAVYLDNITLDGLDWTSGLPFTNPDNIGIQDLDTGFIARGYNALKINTMNGIDVSDLEIRTRWSESIPFNEYATIGINQEQRVIIYDRLGIPDDSNGEETFPLNNITTMTAEVVYGDKNYLQSQVIVESDFFDYYLPEQTKVVKVRFLYWLDGTEGEDYYHRISARLTSNDEPAFWFYFSETLPQESSSPYYIQNIRKNAVVDGKPTVGYIDDYIDITSTSTILSNHLPSTTIASTDISMFLLVRREGYTVLNVGGSTEPTGSVVFPEDYNLTLNDGINPVRLVEFSGASWATTEFYDGTSDFYTAYRITGQGLIGMYIATVNGTDVTIDNNYIWGDGDNVRITNDSIVFFLDFVDSPVPAPLENNVGKRVINVSDNNNFTIDSAFTNGGTGWILVYASSGITDASKVAFCRGVIGKKVPVTVPAGSISIPLPDTDGLAVGQYVQFSGAIPANVSIASIGTNEITLELEGFPVSTTAEIPIEAYVTFVDAALGGTINRESCVLPLDVSPPFVGTEDGLDSNGNGIRSTFTSTTGFTVIAGELESENSTVDTISTDITYNRKIEYAERTVNNETKYYYILGNKL